MLLIQANSNWLLIEWLLIEVNKLSLIERLSLIRLLSIERFDYRIAITVRNMAQLIYWILTIILHCYLRNILLIDLVVNIIDEMIIEVVEFCLLEMWVDGNYNIVVVVQRRSINKVTDLLNDYINNHSISFHYITLHIDYLDKVLGSWYSVTVGNS